MRALKAIWRRATWFKHDEYPDGSTMVRNVIALIFIAFVGWIIWRMTESGKGYAWQGLGLLPIRVVLVLFEWAGWVVVAAAVVMAFQAFQSDQKSRKAWAIVFLALSLTVWVYAGAWLEWLAQFNPAPPSGNGR